MRTILEILLMLGFLLAALCLRAQEPVQTIRGTVLDKETQAPLTGAEIAVLTTDPLTGDISDADGNFKIEKIAVGRHTLQVTYLGYEPLTLPNLLLTSGKELVLNLELVESAVQLEVATVIAKHDKAEALNEMATVSARSFSVEETSRYAGSFYDPARMATNYAGVAVGSSDDLSNEIVVRGNSPSGILWRLEGVEIPNPNHFGSIGGSGGGISMLSSSTLSNSDFYTGAFPSEFGNALAGVFDLNMRNGNNEQREYAIMFGALGLEGAVEGPFRKGGNGSYLVNFRYATLGLLAAAGINIAGDVTPKYSDISFKMNMPTARAGTFALFGLAGQNNVQFYPKKDSTTWEGEFGEWGFKETASTATVGLSHRILLSNDSYLRTVAVVSRETDSGSDYWLDPESNYARHDDARYDVSSYTYRISTTYNRKLDARNTLRAGSVLSYSKFNFTYDDDDNFEEDKGDELIRLFDNHGDGSFLQAFGQWKHRFDDRWTLNTGLHYSMFLLNNKFAIEPRAALEWKLSRNQSLSAAVGLHSKREHLAAYVFEGTLIDGAERTANPDLELTKSMHAVLGYDHRLNEHLRLKAEFYYQYLYDVPVETLPGSTKSFLNDTDIWDIIFTEKSGNDGTGRNLGVDLTLEKFFTNNYYFLVTGSVYQSRYTPVNGIEYPTRYDGRYTLHTLAGKEFKLGRNKKNILGFNGKALLAGGSRYTPIDLAASIEEGEQVEYEDRPFESKAGDYWRIDVGVSYKINKQRLTHTVLLDIQNVTGRLNVYSQYYDNETKQLETYTQTGFFPVFNYRVEF
ncbi:MAG: carboxypeptidase-like regulatory domain-containing protein [Bacteroidetes bacterium]|nr:carboxypeptidase-like regulatory domain-containing protein [Bacteroidota bacterium]